MKKVGFLTSVLVGFFVTSGYVHAHGDAHPDALTPANGGQVQVAGPNHFELVVAKTSKDLGDNPVLVYVTDDAGKKLSTSGATGTAMLLAGKDKAVVVLTPDGENRMKGMGKYASTPGLKALVSVTLAGKAAEQARFTPLAVGDGHTDHTH